MNDFGNFLYALRKERGMTQQELADMLGITNKAVSKWETGEAFPETAQLVPLATIFGVTVDELLRGERNERTVQTVDALLHGTAENGGAMSGTKLPESGNAPAMSEAGRAEEQKPDMAQWRRTRAVLAIAAVCVTVFALAYLVAACLAEGVTHREVVVRGSVCLLLMALAVAGSCVAGIITTQKLYRATDEDVKNALRRLRLTAVLGLLLLMLGVCCFVFFQLYATPQYYHNSALIAGMIAGCAFVVVACALLALGIVQYLSAARRQERK